MAATETSRQNIGSLFGGKVTSVNYNFQAGPQPSTCTLVIVNEDNEFAIPELNELVSVPPFSLQMRVMQTSITQDSNRKSLQVELIDPLSEILDKELVLIYGEHTDLEYNLNKNPYYLLKSDLLPSTSSPLTGNISFNPVNNPLGGSKYTIKNFGGGINVIGFGRLSYKAKRSVDLGKGLNDYTGHYWITYDAKKLNRELTNWSHDFPERVKFSDEGISKLDLKFGYCLRNLKDLMLSKGISFDSGSLRFLTDENLLFTTTGSIRNAFSSALAKIGKSFYVDPFTQKIHIVTSADINNINTNLSAKYSQFENSEAAQQVSLTKSLKGVTSTHFVVKGDINDERPDKPEEDDPRPRKQAFYRLDPNKYLKEIYKSDEEDANRDDDNDGKERELFKRVAAIVSEVEDDNAINKYIFSLPHIDTKFPTKEWGSFYGQDEYDYQDRNVLTKKQGYWYKDLEKETDFNFNGFDLENAKEAIILNPKTGSESATTASESGYVTQVKDLSSLYAGVFVSNAMTKKQSETRDYSNSTFSGRKEHTYQIIVKESKELIKDIPELSFLENIAKYAKENGYPDVDISKNITVEDLAEKAHKVKPNKKEEKDNPDPQESEIPEEEEGDDREIYYAIAIRDVFYGLTSRNTVDAKKVIDKHLFLYNDGVDTILVLTKEAKEKIQELRKAAKRAYGFSRGKSRLFRGAKSISPKNKLIVKYLPFEPTQDDENRDEQAFEKPSLFALQHLPSRVTNFSERNLGKFTGGYSEVGLFLQNNGDINPQFEGPFVTADIKYFRPPIEDDFKISDGVDSVGISISNGGITTSVRYSSRKFAQLDNSITTDIGHQSFVREYRNAFFKNSQGL